ncbi:MAG: heavy-metal-associated domain-containing protein [Candidatus Zixiibacteriota bacterium]
MKKFAFICMVIAIAALVAAPAIFACDGAKTADKASASSCSGSKVTTASATSKDNVAAVNVGSSCSKDGAAKTGATAGASCTAAEKAACAAKTGTTAGASCTAAEKAACAAKTGTTTAGATCSGGAKTTTAGATLPNGHPELTVADALQCGTAMVAFVNVDKMTCGGCVAGVNKAVGSIDGVCAVETSLDKKMSTIVFHPDKVKTDDLVASITKAGFVATMKSECTEDMKAVFGADFDPAKCAKVCANSAACTKKDTKSSES